MHAIRLSVWATLLLSPAAIADPGVLPVGGDGKPLNLDFETGTLKDWVADGSAFEGQPIKDDTVKPRRNDMTSGHQGKYWIGGYEKFQDRRQGTLTSVPFRVTHRWATFMVAGGTHLETCVELIRKDTGAVFHRSSGLESETLQRVLVDLKDVQGKEIVIRIVDRHSGHWGHVNFDDFRFHTEKPAVAERPRVAGPDSYAHAGLTGAESVKAMKVPAGFKVSLFAGEPDVRQPVAMCFDDRGRLWVVEAFTYPRRHPHPGPVLPADKKGLGDRVLIFQDTNGDGVFDRRTVFMEGLNLVSGIEVGFGGVWIGAAPYLLFVPWDGSADKPTGEPKILLDGWGYEDTHETLNSFIWGPDGWLYGCHGVFTRSRVGKPGTADADRIPINAGIWRFHPTRHEFEVFAHGTSNPWGLDYNMQGDWFCEACVIPHMWHIIQGARYQRQAGTHFNPYTYADIPTIAKHRHYVGATPHSGNGRSDEVGGGHAHSGLVCYQGAGWPKEYHGKLLMGNVHGHRINIDVIQPQGSGYAADRHPDFLLTNDRHSLIVALQTGPDGNLYFIDWYDKQICHRNEPEIWDRSNGRIYRVSHKDSKPVIGLDLTKLSNDDLVALHSHADQWYVRHSRRILQERIAADPKQADPIRAAVRRATARKSEPSDRLRLLWLGYVCGEHQHNADFWKSALSDSDSAVRSEAVRMAFQESGIEKNGPVFDQIRTMASRDPSAAVRGRIAAGLQRIPAKNRLEMLAMLASHTEDSTDHNIPLLLWYAMEPIAAVDAEAAMGIAVQSKMALHAGFMSRRLATTGTPEALAILVKHAGAVTDDSTLRSILSAMADGLRGRRKIGVPNGWKETFAKASAAKDAQTRSLAITLSAIFGDTGAFAELRRIAADNSIDLAARMNAVNTLVEARDVDTVAVLQKLVNDARLRGAAIRGLGAFADPKTPAILLAGWKTYTTEERRDVLNTLAGRADYAKALLDAIGDKRIATTEVSADIVRQIRSLSDKNLAAQADEVWGRIRSTPADKAKAITALRRQLTTTEPTDLSLGRAMYAKVCQQCHTLYGVGMKIGPDITGSNRGNLDYLLENILDPSAVIPKDYMPTRFDLKNGRTVTGLIKARTPAAITVQTPNEVLNIATADIDTMTDSTTSMMPDDLLKPLAPHEVRALFAYLRSTAQVPMAATTENAKDLFNGRDLTGWTGNPALWSVDNGEIVGKTAGLKKNEFLKSDYLVGDFRLAVKVKLTPNKENSGIQFRSEVLPDGDVKGPQADIGTKWWGKLYEEHGRGILANEGGEKFVKPDDWNDYVIEARGTDVVVKINGQVATEYKGDPQLARRGIIALQLHSGGPMEIRFRDIKLEVLSPK